MNKMDGMKSVVRIVVMLVLFGIFMVACSNYVCPAYRAKVDKTTPSTLHS
jgi:hypothetical protein